MRYWNRGGKVTASSGVHNAEDALWKEGPFGLCECKSTQEASTGLPPWPLLLMQIERRGKVQVEWRSVAPHCDGPIASRHAIAVASLRAGPGELFAVGWNRTSQYRIHTRWRMPTPRCATQPPPPPHSSARRGAGSRGDASGRRGWRCRRRCDAAQTSALVDGGTAGRGGGRDARPTHVCCPVACDAVLSTRTQPARCRDPAHGRCLQAPARRPRWRAGSAGSSAERRRARRSARRSLWQNRRTL